MKEYSRRDFVKTIGLGAAAIVAPQTVAAAPKRKPNIVFFLVDDMGWMDTTVYGSKYYDTPNMERLAKRSMKFTDAYTASPLCSPTRGSIMTGKHPARIGITTAVGHRPPLPPDAPRYPQKAGPTRKILLPHSRRFLRPEEYTIAEALRDGGHRTAHIGKWHLGLNPEHWPERQGFDLSFHGAPDPGPRSYFSPYQFKAGTVTDGPEGEYIADRVTDEGLKFIEAHRNEPFFLNLWHYSVHGPWGHKEEITKQFVGKEDPRGEQGNPIMASMLKSVDESLGRVLDKLDELGIADDTIVIFFSDNGGNVHSNTDRDPKMSRIKKGHPRWPMVSDWRKYAGVLPPTNNAPLRAGKGHIYEGGTRVPLMVRWPGVVKPGAKCSEIVSSIDFYPTILEMTRVRPKRRQLVDGESIVPLLRQTGKLKRDAIYCHFPHGGPTHPPGVYVRKGDWKLIRWFETSESYPSEHELYNLERDIGETNNLADKMPEKVKELNGLIDKFLADTGALVPKPNPAYDPSMAPVHGWRPAPGTKLALKDGALHVESKKRPFISTSSVPQAGGALMVRLRMRATGGRAGRVYWGSTRKRQFVPERRVDIKPTYDGQWHEYTAKFTVESPLIQLRIDPSIIPCAADIDWIRLCKDDGIVLKAWEFGD